MQSGKGHNSPEVHAQLVSQAFVEITPPPGVEFQTPEHWELWRMYTSRRLPNEWHKSELCLVAKLVHNEYNLRRYYEQLSETGPVVKGARGQVVNPVLRSIDITVRLSNNILSRLGILQSFDVRGINKRADKAHQVKEATEKRLLAKAE